MIDLYTWPTPNGQKVQILLEELNLPYRVHPVDIGRGDQFAPDFLAISPNNKVPAIVDPAGPDGKSLALFESGAILIYLADKTGAFLPQAGAARYHALAWLMFQMGGLGPMLGQVSHFNRYAPEPVPYAQNRYDNEAGRLYRVVEERLAAAPWLGGESYSIADMAAFPWLQDRPHKGQQVRDYPHLAAWHERLWARPAVRRGMAVLAEQRREAIDQTTRENLFGAAQYGAHPAGDGR